MRIERRTEGEALILDLIGDMTVQNCQEVRDTFLNAVSQGQRRLALNFSLVPTIDSAGLATLVEIVLQARRHEVRLGFYALSERACAVMEITNLHRVFPIFQDETTTLAKVGSTGEL